MNKKDVMLWTGIGGGLLLILIAVWGFMVWNSSSKAQRAADAYAAQLLTGDLELVKMKYAPIQEKSQEELAQSVLRDENGNAAAQFITKQELLAMYGEELVQSGRPEMNEQQRLLAMIMKYSKLNAKTGMVPGKRATLKLTLTGPDFTTWMDGLSTQEQLGIFLLAEDPVAELESRLSAGEIPMRTVPMRIPMMKQRGAWKFEMSKEQETELYGGLRDGGAAGSLPE